MEKFFVNSLVFLCLLLVVADKASAMNNETLYTSCKPFVEKGFDRERLTKKDIGCTAFVMGILMTEDHYCRLGQMIKDTQLKSIASDTAMYHLNEIIQSYVNYMAENPKKWKYPPAGYIGNFATQYAPCE